MHPGHHWLYQFGRAYNDTSCEEHFTLDGRKWETYKGSRFYNGERAFVLQRWQESVDRVDEDSLGLTFEEWDPKQNADASQSPLAMLINSSELRAAGFKLKEVLPLHLQAAVRAGMRTGSAGIFQVQGMNPRRFVLSDVRSPCE